MGRQGGARYLQCAQVRGSVGQRPNAVVTPVHLQPRLQLHQLLVAASMVPGRGGHGWPTASRGILPLSSAPLTGLSRGRAGAASWGQVLLEQTCHTCLPGTAPVSGHPRALFPQNPAQLTVVPGAEPGSSVPRLCHSATRQPGVSPGPDIASQCSCEASCTQTDWRILFHSPQWVRGPEQGARSFPVWSSPRCWPWAAHRAGGA